MPRSLSFVEKGFKTGEAGPADGQARAVGENGQAAVLAVGLDARDALQVHDVRAVDAHEAVGIEAGFQAGDGLLLEMLFPLTVSLPQRENRGNSGAVHQGFGKKGEFTGEWR